MWFSILVIVKYFKECYFNTLPVTWKLLGTGCWDGESWACMVEIAKTSVVEIADVLGCDSWWQGLKKELWRNPKPYSSYSVAKRGRAAAISAKPQRNIETYQNREQRALPVTVSLCSASFLEARIHCGETSTVLKEWLCFSLYKRVRSKPLFQHSA